MFQFSIFIYQFYIYHINAFLQNENIVFIILLYNSYTRYPQSGFHLNLKIVITWSELSHLSQLNCVANLLNELCSVHICIVFDDWHKKIGLKFCQFEFLILSIYHLLLFYTLSRFSHINNSIRTYCCIDDITSRLENCRRLVISGLLSRYPHALLIRVLIPSGHYFVWFLSADIVARYWVVGINDVNQCRLNHEYDSFLY